MSTGDLSISLGATTDKPSLLQQCFKSWKALGRDRFIVQEDMLQEYMASKWLYIFLWWDENSLYYVGEFQGKPKWISYEYISAGNVWSLNAVWFNAVKLQNSFVLWVKEGVEKWTLFLDGPWFMEGFCGRKNWSWSLIELLQPHTVFLTFNKQRSSRVCILKCFPICH